MRSDPDALRGHAAYLREQAVDLRAIADRLVAQTEALGWRGRAADALRERVAVRAGLLRAGAVDHETAGETLARHADATTAAADEIAAVERRVAHEVLEARARVEDAGAGGREPDSRDVAWVTADTPPSGHPDWLTWEEPR